MIRNILSITLAAMLIGAPMMTASANNMIEIVDSSDIDNFGVSISINQNVLHVSGAQGQVMKIYNVAGVCVMTVNVDSADKHYDLNLNKGCYIVKVGKVVRKISIR